MTPDDLIACNASIAAKFDSLQEKLDQLAPASADAESVDHDADALAEALFLRTFISYEFELERLFFHYVTGGASISGRCANTHLRLTDEAAARKLVKAGWRFLSWAKPDAIRQTAITYIESGWPLSDMLAAHAQDLSDCEKVRNRIAHNSLESAADFSAVQRNLFGTERLFVMTPGQLLRIRHRSRVKLNIHHYTGVMRSTLEAVLDPPI